MEEGMKNQSRSQEGNGNQAKQRLDWSRRFLFFIFDLGWVFLSVSICCFSGGYFVFLDYWIAYWFAFYSFYHLMIG
jgi:hypothetical protein